MPIQKKRRHKVDAPTLKAPESLRADGGLQDRPRKRRFIWMIIGLLASTGAVLGDLHQGYSLVAEPIKSLSAQVRDRLTAYRLNSTRGYADTLGRKQLAALPFGTSSCFTSTVPLDLDADGIASDLAVLFHRKSEGQNCEIAAGSPEDAAFFKSDWSGLRFVGNPELPKAITSWRFAGPVAFRLAADGNYPTLFVFMMKDGRMSMISGLDTTAFYEFKDIRVIENSNGKSAWALADSFIAEAGVDYRGHPFVRELDPKTLDDGLHLLTWKLGEELMFDGSAQHIEEGPAADKQYSVAISPGDRMYVIGCFPIRGLKEIESLPGAYTVNLNSGPELRCPLGEHATFSVKIAPKDF